MAKEYDVVVIGGGPTGLSAGLYAARALRKTAIIERAVTGGQISLTSLVENYPGFPDGISGFDLAQAMQRQAEKYGAEMLYGEVTEVEKRGNMVAVTTSEGEEIHAKALIVTSGAEHNRLGVPGEDKYTGRGVSYCATCDAAFVQGEPSAVVGGGDAAIDEGLFVARYATKVYVIHRRDQLRASKILQERAFANPKFEFIWNTVVTEIAGDQQMKLLKLRDVKTGEESTLEVGSLFVFIGLHPNTGYLDGVVKLDESGHIYVNQHMETDVPGIFAAGDARVNSARQVATGVGDGVTAALRAEHYIQETFG